jgi:dihydrofolate synthase/folylpolyglutamate synthase
VRLEERFVIDGREIDSAALETSAATIQHVVESLVDSGALESWPTFFECSSAMAFDLFRRAAVEVAVIEVGLGGRLDATNVIRPAATAIVSIAFDHEAQLGHTLASIAAEKAGIAKAGVPLICGPVPDEARQVIERICQERGAPFVRADTPDVIARVRALPRSLAGEHQIGNAAVAVRLLETLGGRGIAVDATAIATGLATARWPGRLETFLAGGTTVLVDAAHNPAGARALAAYVRTHHPRGVTLVFGAMRDKAIEPMLDALAEVACRIICTTAPSPRAMEADALADGVRRRGRDVRAIANPDEALTAAIEMGDPVVVAGSIVLIGPLRESLARGILR